MKSKTTYYSLTAALCVLLTGGDFPASAQEGGFDVETEVIDFSSDDLLKDDVVSQENEPVLLESSEIILTQEPEAVTPEVTTPPEQALDLPTATVTEAAAAPEIKAVPHSGTYYDSASIMGGSNTPGPREVDPRYEPGSSFVVVSKTAGADSQPARIIAAQRALELGRYTSALELYEDLYKKNPKNKQILMGLAVAQQESGFDASALATYDELIKLDPNNLDAVANMLGLMKEQSPAMAMQKLQELWARGDVNSNIASELGLASAQLGQTQDAMKYLGVAVSMEPNNPIHFYNMAVISDRAGAKKDAIEYYEKALEVNSTTGAGLSIDKKQIYDRLSHLRSL